MLNMFVEDLSLLEDLARDFRHGLKTPEELAEAGVRRGSGRGRSLNCYSCRCAHDPDCRTRGNPTLEGYALSGDAHQSDHGTGRADGGSIEQGGPDYFSDFTAGDDGGDYQYVPHDH